jgi:hypothetical protein
MAHKWSTWQARSIPLGWEVRSTKGTWSVGRTRVERRSTSETTSVLYV